MVKDFLFFFISEQFITIFKYLYVYSSFKMATINDNIKFKAKIFSALADPIRLEIINFLKDGEKCVCEITPYLNLAQPLVSRHLKILKNTGIIKRRKEGTWHFYSLTDKRVDDLIENLTPELTESIKRKIIEQIV